MIWPYVCIASTRLLVDGKGQDDTYDIALLLDAHLAEYLPKVKPNQIRVHCQSHRNRLYLMTCSHQVNNLFLAADTPSSTTADAPDYGSVGGFRQPLQAREDWPQDNC